MQPSKSKEERESFKKERDESLVRFLKVWEKEFGHVPIWRRTKHGQFMFDEGLPTQFIVDSCLIGRYAHLLETDGKQILQLRFFKH